MISIFGLHYFVTYVIIFLFLANSQTPSFFQWMMKFCASKRKCWGSRGFLLPSLRSPVFFKDFMAIFDTNLKAIRAKEMIALKTGKGMSNKEIAAEMGVHPDTVARALTWAKKAGLFVKYEDDLLESVVPKALEALKAALDDGDGELAIKVLENTIWLTNQKGNKGDVVEENSLASYIRDIRLEAERQQESIEGKMVDEQRLLPPGEKGE